MADRFDKFTPVTRRSTRRHARRPPPFWRAGRSAPRRCLGKGAGGGPSRAGRPPADRARGRNEAEARVMLEASGRTVPFDCIVIVVIAHGRRHSMRGN